MCTYVIVTGTSSTFVRVLASIWGPINVWHLVYHTKTHINIFEWYFSLVLLKLIRFTVGILDPKQFICMAFGIPY